MKSGNHEIQVFQDQGWSDLFLQTAVPCGHSVYGHLNCNCPHVLSSYEYLRESAIENIYLLSVIIYGYFFKQENILTL